MADTPAPNGNGGATAQPEDLPPAAPNDAVRGVDSTTQEKMSGFTSGPNLPPGFKLPF